MSCIPILVLIFSLWSTPTALEAKPVGLEDQVREIATDLRCPVCQNLSVADSPAEMAQQMRASIRKQLKEGKDAEQIRSYFISKYGEWVLLAPKRSGFSLLVWLLPFIALIGGIVLALLMASRWVKVKKESAALIDSASIERIRRELGKVRASNSSMQEGPPSLLVQERDKLFGRIEELDFDYQAGRLSEEDYRDLSRDYTAQADAVLKKLEVTPPPPPKTDPTREQGAKEKRSEETNGERSPKTWVFAATAIFLLIFGVTLSIMLRKSVSPRGTDNNSITGGILTGTGGKEIQPLLTEGRASFQQQDWPKAIESFKKALAIDPGHPEAHAYLGMILVKADHPEGALLAFNQALARDPNFPLALWWKGMVLYHDKEDLPAAREVLEKLAGLLPLGQDKDRIEEILGKIRQRQDSPDQGKNVMTVSNRIEGEISIAPGLQSKADKNSVLFIILRPADAKGGPPMVVKRISSATFPLSYSLGPEDVMAQGKPFHGKVKITARLDKDGNAMTKEPGSLLGRYEWNPVEIGSKNIDFTLDQEL